MVWPGLGTQVETEAEAVGCQRYCSSFVVVGGQVAKTRYCLLDLIGVLGKWIVKTSQTQFDLVGADWHPSWASFPIVLFGLASSPDFRCGRVNVQRTWALLFPLDLSPTSRV